MRVITPKFIMSGKRINFALELTGLMLFSFLHMIVVLTILVTLPFLFKLNLIGKWSNLVAPIDSYYFGRNCYNIGACCKYCIESPKAEVVRKAYAGRLITKV